MQKSTGSYPSLNVDTTTKRVVSHAGAVLLAETVGRVGLDRELSAALRRGTGRLRCTTRAKVLLDLVIAVAIGGDCLADIAQVRAESAVFGEVASDPTVPRLIDTLATDEPAVLTAINMARAAVGHGCGVGRDRRPRPRNDRHSAVDHRLGSHSDHRSLRERAGCSRWR